MPVCRVYLLTYRRNHLLPRALNSLLAQTFTDWVCELHNDDPDDPFPSQLVEEIGDPRVLIVNHPDNLGPTRTFNLIFQPVDEPFICLLEDDNWWEPTFLSTMLKAMEQFQEVHVAWANMRFWTEEPDGTWTDTGKNIWDSSVGQNPRLFDWGQQQQIMGALHSNGAMLVRSQLVINYIIPDETPFDLSEHVRERAFPFPILFVPQVCANFAITLSTSRSNKRITWSQIQALLTASYCKHMSMKPEEIRQMWFHARSEPAKSTGTLFFAALISSDCRRLLHYAQLWDWVFFIASCLKRPSVALATLRSIHSYPNLWNFLDQQTKSRVKELQQASPNIVHSPARQVT